MSEVKSEAVMENIMKLEDILQESKSLANVLRAAGVTLQQFNQADDKSIICNCLILKSKEYPDAAFESRTDIRYVAAPLLRKASALLFRKCENLAQISCDNLEEIADQESNIQGSSGVFSHTGLKEVKSAKLQKVGSYAFLLSAIREIELLNCVEIGKSSFWCCKQLKRASFAKLKVVPDNCFSQCSKLSLVNAPLLQQISMFGFRFCTSLREIRFQNLKSIGKSAFQGCTSLKTAVLPRLSELGDSAFIYAPIANLHCLSEQIVRNSGIKDATAALRNGQIANFVWKTGFAAAKLKNCFRNFKAGMKFLKSGAE